MIYHQDIEVQRKAGNKRKVYKVNGKIGGSQDFQRLYLQRFLQYRRMHNAQYQEKAKTYHPVHAPLEVFAYRRKVRIHKRIYYSVKTTGIQKDGQQRHNHE